MTELAQKGFNAIFPVYSTDWFRRHKCDGSPRMKFGISTFFTKEGAEKAFCLAQGLKWTGGCSIDDYC